MPKRLCLEYSNLGRRGFLIVGFTFLSGIVESPTKEKCMHQIGDTEAIFLARFLESSLSMELREKINTSRGITVFSILCSIHHGIDDIPKDVAALLQLRDFAKKAMPLRTDDFISLHASLYQEDPLPEACVRYLPGFVSQVRQWQGSYREKSREYNIKQIALFFHELEFLLRYARRHGHASRLLVYYLLCLAGIKSFVFLPEDSQFVEAGFKQHETMQRFFLRKIREGEKETRVENSNLRLVPFPSTS